MNWYKRAKTPEKDLGLKRNFDDLTVNVEHPAGTDRLGVNGKGEEWRTTMKYDYGFIYAAEGADGEGLDVYLGPDDEAEKVYIVHQNNPETGEYDEDKCMLGFRSEKKAREAYLEHYDSEDYLGSMTTLSLQQFKKDIKNKAGEIKWKKNN